MKVKASELFKDYRCLVLGLDVKDFRALQDGKEVEITQEQYKKCKAAYTTKEVKKDGDKRNSIQPVSN